MIVRLEPESEENKLLFSAGKVEPGSALSHVNFASHGSRCVDPSSAQRKISHEGGRVKFVYTCGNAHKRYVHKPYISSMHNVIATLGSWRR